MDYDKLMSAPPATNEGSYTDLNTMLYALGVGFQRDPMNEAELPFTYEKDLRTVPTMATVINWGGGGGAMAEAGINYLMVVHGEQKIHLHQPLPPAADFVAESKILGAWDKGADKGAVIATEQNIKLKSGEPLVTLTSTTFARGDGGFGGPKDGAPEAHTVPSRKPDLTVEVDTRPDQAFLYALSGDRNPLHRDPAIAKAAGFPRPIIHGLCTYGSACRGILQHVCDYDHTKIIGFDVRFSAPVFPGETILIDIWRDDPVVSFECRLKERDVTCIKAGKCTLAS